jgi:hypothetical protein
LQEISCTSLTWKRQCITVTHINAASAFTMLSCSWFVLLNQHILRQSSPNLHFCVLVIHISVLWIAGSPSFCFRYEEADSRALHYLCLVWNFLQINHLSAIMRNLSRVFPEPHIAFCTFLFTCIYLELCVWFLAHTYKTSKILWKQICFQIPLIRKKFNFYFSHLKKINSLQWLDIMVQSFLV